MKKESSGNGNPSSIIQFRFTKNWYSLDNTSIFDHNFSAINKCRFEGFDTNIYLKVMKKSIIFIIWSFKLDMLTVKKVVVSCDVHYIFNLY